MAFIAKRYNDGFLAKEQAILDRTKNAKDKYKLRIVEADVAEGETYWKVIGVHHLLPDENRSNHHVYLEALDENGQRVRPATWADFTWEGRQSGQVAGPVPLDKPDNEAAGNIALHDGQIVSVWMKGMSREAQDKSDRVENLDIIHPDEPGPSGELWNTIGHHSFYLIFQRTRKAAATTTAATAPAATPATPVATAAPAVAPAPPPAPIAAPAPQAGVISGQVINGQRYTVRLWQGSTMVAEQAVDNNGFFRFEGLPNGVYIAQAVGPVVNSNPIQLDANQLQAVINITA